MYCWEVWSVFHKFKIRIILAKLCFTHYSQKYKLRLEEKKVFVFLPFCSVFWWEIWKGICYLHLTGFWIFCRFIVYFLINLKNTVKSTWNECSSTVQRGRKRKIFADFYSGCASCNICKEKITDVHFATISYPMEICICWGHNASEVCLGFSMEDILRLSFSCFLLHYNWRVEKCCPQPNH